MIRNVLITGLVSSVMGVFAVAYTSITQTQDLPIMAGAPGDAADSRQADSLPSPQGLMVFRQQIRPLLVGTCLKCHDSEKRSGGLDLTRRATALTGGETGEAIVSGKPEASLMIQLVTAGEMPKEGNPLSSETIAALTQWIELDAPYESEPLAFEAGPLAITTQPGMNGEGSAGGMKMCPCMQMMMKGMSGSMGQANQPSATDKLFSNPRTKDQAKQRAVDHLKSLGNPNLKVGDVNETIASYEIQVVTKDDSLANWIIIDKQSGQLRTLY
ncbi:MAG: hypothetical protein IH991_04525 [Planctomycetes bacterium]|nr:hypothetical protein [Planctomycetota bacterium]